MNYTTLRVEYEGELATITLARPEKRNAISAAMVNELPAALAEVEHSSARVTILTGEGKAFCAGMDLADLMAMTGQTAEENAEDTRKVLKMFYGLYTFPRPTIAAVNGAAVAGGSILATLCDFTLAVPDAKFGFTEVRIGFIPALVSVFLTRMIGEKRARDLLLTGRIFEAAEAHRIGLVNEILPPSKLMDRCKALAAELLVNSPTSLRETKALLHENGRAELEAELERAVQANAAIRATADFKEGLASFLEKRKPNWTGK